MRVGRERQDVWIITSHGYRRSKLRKSLLDSQDVESSELSSVSDVYGHFHLFSPSLALSQLSLTSRLASLTILIHLGPI
jgi:hypothetical protein